MSLTSCYRYILELPVNTLSAMLRGAMSESGPAGVLITRHWANVPIGSNHADVDVRPDDLDAHPPTMILTAADLGFTLHLRMRAEVKVLEFPDLDLIIYTLEFDLPGSFLKDTSTPPKLIMQFPAVTAPDLNLAITGGDIPLTPALIEPRIHEMYDNDPSLGHEVLSGQPWIKFDTTSTTVQVTSDIYDDTPGDPGFRGAISVEVPDATSIVIVMPGHIKIQGISGPPFVDRDMTLRITVAVVTNQAAGELRVKLSAVQQADVAVAFNPPAGSPSETFYFTEAQTGLKLGVADKINNFPDYVQDIPSAAEVRSLIETQLVDMAHDLVIPIFTPATPAAGEVDLTTFVPTTVAQQALALQIEPLGDGTQCDAPDVFSQADGFSIAISAVEVNSILQPILQGNEGDRTAAGYDMTVNNLDGTLSNAGDHGQADGHIWIEGDTDVHVDCWPDPNVEFQGPVFLTPSLDPDNKLVFTAHAGGFTADDPCCGDVNPADIAALIEGEQSTPVKMPTNFTGVGTLTLGVTDAVISAAGVVVHGTLTVATTSALHASAIRKTLYWFNEMAGGGL